MKLIAAPSPNFDARTRPPDMLVLHYTGMPTGEAALARLRDPEAKVSAHYVVEEDGRVFTLVPEERRAWHAGRSSWRGERDVNGCSIGIEIVNPGHEFGYRPFPDAQIEAVIALVAAVRTRWTIPDARILGHSDVAPDRKEDPGERFDWEGLARNGVGLWPDGVPDLGTAEALRDAAGLRAVRAALAVIGYRVAPEGALDPPLASVLRAFQRHWRPAAVTGEADADTCVRADAVARLCSR